MIQLRQFSLVSSSTVFGKTLLVQKAHPISGYCWRQAATMATVFPIDSNGIEQASEWLQAGKCVAFPTETVYGLGANALNEEAVLNIFKYKGRPLTDPLIVHVPSKAVAESVVHVTSENRAIFDTLAGKFWPGPLTLVLKSQPSVPLKVSAGTGYVGVRSPAHPVAAALLEASQLPVAAPSANRFGHVSPTSAAHVLSDLGGQPIGVLDAEGGAAAEAQQHSTCAVGIESTVLGISDDGKTLTMFRRGGLPKADIAAALQAAGVAGWAWAESAAAAQSAGSAADTAAAANSNTDTAEEAASGGEDAAPAAVAPGQLLTHYAPDIVTYMLPALPAGAGAVVGDAPELRHCALIDFAGTYAALQPLVGAYHDLSAEGDAAAAAQGVYAALRWTEAAAAAEGSDIRLALLPSAALAEGDDAAAAVRSGHGMASAVVDRLFRAASGKRLPVGAGAWGEALLGGVRAVLPAEHSGAAVKHV